MTALHPFWKTRLPLLHPRLAAVVPRFIRGNHADVSSGTLDMVLYKAFGFLREHYENSDSGLDLNGVQTQIAVAAAVDILQALLGQSGGNRILCLRTVTTTVEKGLRGEHWAFSGKREVGGLDLEYGDRDPITIVAYLPADGINWSATLDLTAITTGGDHHEREIVRKRGLPGAELVCVAPTNYRQERKCYDWFDTTRFLKWWVVVNQQLFALPGAVLTPEEAEKKYDSADSGW